MEFSGIRKCRTVPYSVNWLIENEIVYVRYSGTITVEELRASLLESMDYMERSPRALVHSINDVGDVVEPVSIKDSLAVVRELGTHPRAGWTFTIREKSKMIRMSSGLGASVFKIRYRAFDTLDEALEYLKGFDSAISWDKLDLSLTEPMTN